MAQPAIAHKGRTVRKMAVDPAAVFLTGAAVILDAEGEIAEAGATPTDIVGFSAEPAAITSGDPPLRVDVHPGEALILVAQPHSTFLMELWASSAQIEPATADIGVSYGIAKDTNGAWYVDQDNTTQLAVKVVDIRENPENAPTPSLVEVQVINPILG